MTLIAFLLFWCAAHRRREGFSLLPRLAIFLVLTTYLLCGLDARRL